MRYFYKYDSSLGDIILSSNGEKLTGLWFDNQKYVKEDLPLTFTEEKLEIFELTEKWLDLYFKGKNPKFKIPIFYELSDFRKEVYHIIQEIPYGETRTYGQIAQIIANKRNIKTMSSQAVGTALGHNPISIIIPCHRILGKDDFIGGYAGGIERKLKLLEIEGFDLRKIRTKK